MKKVMATLLVMLLALGFAACATVPALEETETVPLEAEPAPQEADPNVVWVYPEMVMIDGEMYLTTCMESTLNPRWAGYDGKIISTVSGSERPTENDQSNFGTGYGYQFGEMEGTVEIEINGKWLIFATEEVRHQIQFPEQHMVVDCPPDLIVNYGDQSVKARHCLTNWEFTMEDGMISALMGDGPHPLMAKHTSPYITLDPAEPMEIWLSWDIMPDLVEVNCWGEEAWEELETEPLESYRIMEGNEAGDSYLLRPENGNYIYEIIATWQNAPNFGGTVRYSFHTQTCEE